MSPRALLVAVCTTPTAIVDADELLAELRLLAVAAGAEVAGTIVQRRQEPDPSTFIGKGKLEELMEVCNRQQTAVVIFDEPLSPAQLRNVENALGRLVMDRSQLILDIFACRARSREGQYQVELAQLQYLLPRLSGRGVDLSRLGGGIGTRGPGETKLETDRRKIRNRIGKIRRELARVDAQRQVQGRRRRDSAQPSIALVGYTNAGKSTLFRSLTGEEVLVSSQPFSTLDPLIRRLSLPNGQTALVSDTVGFIRKLPHSLVAAFRATLEEVTEADLLLNVVDASVTEPEEQVEAVEEVLGELDVGHLPRIDVLNKTDLLEDDGEIAGMLPRFRQAVAVSAVTGKGRDELLARIVEVLCSARPATIFKIPQDDGAVIADLYEQGRVLRRWYDGGAVLLRAEVAPLLARRYRSYVVDESQITIS
ncbi:MAG: GTPase HflX [Acidobacteriota bacterium]